MPISISREQLFNIGATEIQVRNKNRSPNNRISREAIYTPGSDVNVMLAAAAAMADECVRQDTLRQAATYLASASGEDLDRLIFDRYSPSIVRKRATSSVVTLTLSREIPPSNGNAFTLPTGTSVSTPDGIEFITTNPASFPLNSTGPITVSAQAVYAGTEGNVDIGTITDFTSNPGEPSLVVTNNEVAAGGTDTESDELLKSRARLFWQAVSKGTISAIEFGALTTPGVYKTTAEEQYLNNEPTGVIRLYISDVNGQSNQLLVSAVQNTLREYRAGGVVVNILSTIPRYEQISYRVSFVQGIDTTAAIQQIKDLTVQIINNLEPGEDLLISQLYSILRSVPGVIVNDDAIQLPQGDVIISGTGDIIKTRADLISVNGF